jgi:molybdopterin synthase sulfur carrier subunit
MSTVDVRVPTILRTYTKGEADVSVTVADDATLAHVVTALDDAYPGIAARVLDDAGKIRRFVNVYVNDNDVRFADGLQTPTPDGAKISVIPAVAGG